MANKRVIGASRLRRKLQRMPDEVTAELRKTILREGQGVLNEMKARAPYDRDSRLRNPVKSKEPRPHLRDALEMRVSRRGLKVEIGLIGKRVMKVFYFARFLEFGWRTGRRAISSRYITKLAARGDFAKIHAHQQASRKFIRKPFMFPAWRARRDGARAAVREATERALQRVAALPLSDA